LLIDSITFIVANLQLLVAHSNNRENPSNIKDKTTQRIYWNFVLLLKKLLQEVEITGQYSFGLTKKNYEDI